MSNSPNPAIALNTLKVTSQAVVDHLVNAKETIHGSKVLNSYVQQHLNTHPTLRKLYEYSETLGHLKCFPISVDEGAVLQLLVRIMGAKRCLDIGSFTGFSALAVALALPDDGVVTAIEMEEQWARVVENFFTEAQVHQKLDLHVGKAADILQSLIDGGKQGTYDFAFIDADKSNYITYYQLALELLRPGGAIAVDNVFWLDKVADPEHQDPDTIAIRAFNDFIAADPRVDIAYLSNADGVALCYKK